MKTEQKKTFAVLWRRTPLIHIDLFHFLLEIFSSAYAYRDTPIIICYAYVFIIFFLFIAAHTVYISIALCVLIHFFLHTQQKTGVQRRVEKGNSLKSKRVHRVCSRIVFFRTIHFFFQFIGGMTNPYTARSCIAQK